jgi:hypothetical protein
MSYVQFSDTKYLVIIIVDHTLDALIFVYRPDRIS